MTKDIELLPQLADLRRMMSAEERERFVEPIVGGPEGETVVGHHLKGGYWLMLQARLRNMLTDIDRMHVEAEIAARRSTDMESERPAPATPPLAVQDGEVHPDDLAVDRFAVAMKAKLKWEREERGRAGWQGMSADELSRLLREHLPKGDAVDVANFCMMLSLNGQSITTPPSQALNAGDGEPAAWEGYWSGAGSVDSQTVLTRFRSTMEKWEKDGAEITPLYLRPAGTVSVSDEMVEAAAKAIAENHWSVDSDFMKAVHVANTWQYHTDDARDALVAALSSKEA